MSTLATLPVESLEALRLALEAGRLRPPWTLLTLHARLGDAAAGAAESLQSLSAEGFSAPQIARVVGLIEERARLDRAAADQRVKLVWTGPERGPTQSRETLQVIEELFTTARSSIIVSTYSTYEWQEQAKRLARHMRDRERAGQPLDVKLFVGLGAGKNSTGDEALSRFRQQLRGVWPTDCPRPAVYCDHRSLEGLCKGKPHPALHAKCVLVDGERGLITSANLGRPATHDNIEAGVLIQDPGLVSALALQFTSLIASGLLVLVGSA